MGEARKLATHPVHLGGGGRALPQPEFTGIEWYEAYSKRADADGADGRLVSMYDFTADWDSWEMHPIGDELVLCVAGSMVLHQQLPDGSVETITLGAGEYAVNRAGTWHTADIAEAATAVFVTSGLGTDHRPR